MEKLTHHIHKIRQQPEEVKRHILHILTIIFGIILVLLWIYSLGTTFGNPTTQAKIGNDLQPLSTLKDNLVGGYDSMSQPNSQPNTNSDLQAQENSLGQ